MIFEHDIDNAE